VLGLIHLAMLGFARKPWAISTIMVVQFAGAIGGILVHWSITAIMILYIAVWGFGLYLRSIIVERMKRGYLPNPHLEVNNYPCVMHSRVSLHSCLFRRLLLIKQIYRR